MKKLILVSSFASFIFIIFACKDVLQNENHNHLLELINKRLEIAPLVAKSKWNTKLPINDSIREKIILDTVEAKAVKLGINKYFARDFFQAQFDAGKRIQFQLHKKWKNESQPPFNPTINLANEVRPTLDSLTPLILLELKKILDNKKISSKNFRENARKIINPEFDNEVIEIAIKPIEFHIQKKYNY